MSLDPSNGRTASPASTVSDLHGPGACTIPTPGVAEASAESPATETAGSGTDAAGAAGRAWLAHVPVGTFGSVMGIAGLALAWGKAHATLAATPWPARVLATVALALFALLAAVYLAKLLRHPGAVAAERVHPVRGAFLATIPIALLLVATAWAETVPAFARVAWMLGAALQLTLTVLTLDGWLHLSRQQPEHAGPAWFIPVVGNLVVPLAGMSFAPSDVSWFFFAIGAGSWVVLAPMVTWRLMFHGPLPPRLRPTLFVLVAPPAVGFVAYLNLAGEIDGFARTLYFFAMFLTALLLAGASRHARLPFSVSSWAYSFPLAAATVAALTMHGRVGGAFHGAIAVVLLAITTAVVTVLSARTAVAVLRGRLFVPD